MEMVTCSLRLYYLKIRRNCWWWAVQRDCRPAGSTTVGQDTQISGECVLYQRHVVSHVALRPRPNKKGRCGQGKEDGWEGARGGRQGNGEGGNGPLHLHLHKDGRGGILCLSSGPFSRSILHRTASLLQTLCEYDPMLAIITTYIVVCTEHILHDRAAGITLPGLIGAGSNERPQPKIRISGIINDSPAPDLSTGPHFGGYTHCNSILGRRVSEKHGPDGQRSRRRRVFVHGYCIRLRAHIA